MHMHNSKHFWTFGIPKFANLDLLLFWIFWVGSFVLLESFVGIFCWNLESGFVYKLDLQFWIFLDVFRIWNLHLDQMLYLPS
jgi:hypothetical protein